MDSLNALENLTYEDYAWIDYQSGVQDVRDLRVSQLDFIRDYEEEKKCLKGLA